MIESFDKLTSYCDKRGKDILVRNHAYCIYMTVLNGAIKSIPSTQKARIEASSEALLTEQAIEGYISRAETIIQDTNNALIAPYIMTKTNNSFWKNVLSSVVGAFAYSLLLIIIFYLGKDQIATWLNTLTK